MFDKIPLKNLTYDEIWDKAYVKEIFMYNIFNSSTKFLNSSSILVCHTFVGVGWIVYMVVEERFSFYLFYNLICWLSVFTILFITPFFSLGSLSCFPFLKVMKFICLFGFCLGYYENFLRCLGDESTFSATLEIWDTYFLMGGHRIYVRYWLPKDFICVRFLVFKLIILICLSDHKIFN